jgi:hypothetical protein
MWMPLQLFVKKPIGAQPVFQKYNSFLLHWQMLGVTLVATGHAPVLTGFQMPYEPIRSGRGYDGH